MFMHLAPDRVPDGLFEVFLHFREPDLRFLPYQYGHLRWSVSFDDACLFRRTTSWDALRTNGAYFPFSQWKTDPEGSITLTVERIAVGGSVEDITVQAAPNGGEN